MSSDPQYNDLVVKSTVITNKNGLDSFMLLESLSKLLRNESNSLLFSCLEDGLNELNCIRLFQEDYQELRNRGMFLISIGAYVYILKYKLLTV